MAQVIYGFQLYRTPQNGTNEYYVGPGANSQVFTYGDPVYATSTVGLLVETVSSQTCIGISAKTVTMASTNTTVAKVKVPLIPIDESYIFLAGTTSDLTQSAVGALMALDYSGATGLIQVNPTQISVGQIVSPAGQYATLVECLAFDPYGSGDTGAGSGARQGLFKFVKITPSL